MHHMRVLRPAAGIFAFYDGRVDGYRFAQGSNWVDDGALSLGIASYAVAADGEALVYDTISGVGWWGDAIQLQADNPTQS